MYCSPKKDVLFGVITFVLLGYQIHIYISQSELTSIDVLFPQVMIIVIGFASVLDLLHCLHWDIFVPGFLLYFMKLYAFSAVSKMSRSLLGCKLLGLAKRELFE